MAILFYDHLIDINHIHIHLDKYDLDEDKKKSLKDQINDILHTGILDFILSKLPSKNHKTFLTRLEHTPYDPELLKYLQEHIDEKIEDEIKLQAEAILKLIKKDLRG